jgi:cob(I)alamin adenosyltransferase
MTARLIDTERLTLTPFSPEAIDALLRGDAALLRRLVDADFPKPLRPPPLMEELLTQVRDNVRARPSDAGWWTWIAIRRDNRAVVGALGFGGPPDDERAVMIGYATYPEADRRGYGTEAVRALVGWALEQPECKRVCATIPADNTGARRVAEKVGMKVAGEVWDEDVDEVLVYCIEKGNGERGTGNGVTVPLSASRSPLPAPSSFSKIYTRTGDQGETGLFGGGRVPKDHPRVSAYGDVDELNSAIGVARATTPVTFHDDLLQSIQKDLFAIGGHLATPDPDKVKKALAKAELSEDRTTAFEQVIDAAEDELPPLTAFVLPAGSPKAAALHLARTICRRAERSVVHLSHGAPVPDLFVIYLNRLSDLLFTLARLANHREGGREVTW